MIEVENEATVSMLKATIEAIARHEEELAVLFQVTTRRLPAPTRPLAHRRAHECPMASAGAVRCCCAFLRARLAPLTTAHRQGLEKRRNTAPFSAAPTAPLCCSGARLSLIGV